MALIVIGCMVMGFAYAKWLVPDQIINGGVTSLSQIVHHWWPKVSIPVANNGWLALLLVLALVLLGRETFFKSLLASVVYSLSFTAAYRLPVTVTIQPVVDLVIASSFIAFGYYACLSSHASTVGVDVLALIVKKYRPQTNVSRTIRGFNLAVLALGFAAFGWQAVALGVVFAVLYTVELNWLLAHFSRKEGELNGSR